MVGSLEQFLCQVDIAIVGSSAGECVEREHLDVCVARSGGSGEDRIETLARSRNPVGAIHRREQALAERGLFSATSGVMPGAGGLENRSRTVVVAKGASHTSEMHPGERGHSHVAGRFGFFDGGLQGGAAGLVVTGLALRSSETGDLVGLGLHEAEPTRGFRSPGDVSNRIVKPVLEAGELAEHRIAANVLPGIVDSLQPSLDLRAASTLRCSSPEEIAARAVKSQLAT